MKNFRVDSFALSKDFVNVFLIGKVRSALSGDCILSGANLPGSRAEVVILSGPSIMLWDSALKFLVFLQSVRYENVFGANFYIEDVLWKISLLFAEQSNLQILQFDMALNYFRKSHSGISRNVC